MHGTLPARIIEAREIEGRILRGEDKIVPPPKWIEHARLCWPSKIDVHLAAISKVDPRTARRWLSGEFPPPPEIYKAIIDHVFG